MPSKCCLQMLGMRFNSFNKLILACERAELNVHNDLASEQVHAAKKFQNRGRERSMTQAHMIHALNHVQSTPIRRPHGNQTHSFVFRRKISLRWYFTRLPLAPSQILPILLEKGLLVKVPRHPNPECLCNYDHSKFCDYHTGMWYRTSARRTLSVKQSPVKSIGSSISKNWRCSFS